MENNEQNDNDLLISQGLTYTQKSKKLEDARSSSWLFIVFGIAGLLLILAVWLDLLPLGMATYMKILYTIVLGSLFVALIIVGIHYTRKIKVLTSESNAEEQLSQQVITGITASYSLEAIDEMIDAPSLPEEQLYFERYEKIGSLIRENYPVQDENYLDYLIEKVYQIYVPE